MHRSPQPYENSGELTKEKTTECLHLGDKRVRCTKNKVINRANKRAGLTEPKLPTTALAVTPTTGQ